MALLWVKNSVAKPSPEYEYLVRFVAAYTQVVFGSANVSHYSQNKTSK